MDTQTYPCGSGGKGNNAALAVGFHDDDLYDIGDRLMELTLA